MSISIQGGIPNVGCIEAVCPRCNNKSTFVFAPTQTLAEFTCECGYSFIKEFEEKRRLKVKKIIFTDNESKTAE